MGVSVGCTGTGGVGVWEAVTAGGLVGDGERVGGANVGSGVTGVTVAVERSHANVAKTTNVTVTNKRELLETFINLAP